MIMLMEITCRNSVLPLLGEGYPRGGKGEHRFRAAGIWHGPASYWPHWRTRLVEPVQTKSQSERTARGPCESVEQLWPGIEEPRPSPSPRLRGRPCSIGTIASAPIGPLAH